MKNIIKSLLAIGLVSVLVGCKLAVMVPSSGDVKSASGTRNCTGGTLCEHNITDSTFNETFTAVAKPGYVFTKWHKGAGFLCGDSTNPKCTISNVGTAGNAGIESVIATGQLFYAMPLFDFVGIDTDGDGVKDHLDADDDNDGIFDVDDICPLTTNPICGTPISDTVTVTSNIVTANNKEWAQVDLFTNLSWNQINAVCPQGVCVDGGVLNGHDMTGWTWASVSDLSELFNTYGVNPPLPATMPENLVQREEFDSTWAPAFFAAGWRETSPYGRYTFCDTPICVVATRGMLSDTPSSSLGFTYAYISDVWRGVDQDRIIYEVNASDRGYQQGDVGAWFYRQR